MIWDRPFCTAERKFQWKFYNCYMIYEDNFIHFAGLIKKTGSRESAVGIVTWLRVGRPAVPIPVGERDFYLFLNVQNDFGARAASCSTGTVVPSRRLSGWGVKLTTSRHQLQRLIISGAIPSRHGHRKPLKRKSGSSI